MIEVMKDIYVGDEQDFYNIQNQEDWAVLHCCKHPFHVSFVGYRGNLNQDHPQYALARKDCEMALNLVDMNNFSENYLGFNKNMFEAAFEFLNEYRHQGYKILIHCNQGESRGPSLGLLYVSSLGNFNNSNFDISVEQFKQIYPTYNPKGNIYMTVQALWNDFVEEG